MTRNKETADADTLSARQSQDGPYPPADIANMIPYVSARVLNAFDENGIFLDANELPYTFPRSVISGDYFNCYADAGRIELENAYASYAGVPDTCVLAARGIDEIIDLVIRAFCEPRLDSVGALVPTYAAYKVAAEIHRCEYKEFHLSENLSLNLGAVEAEVQSNTMPRIFFYCRPNNPTGHLSDISELRTILDAVPQESIVAVDEAYIEFAPSETCVPLLAEHPNLVIMRTLSKGFGLAGIHTGFCLASDNIISALKKVTNPYPIPDPCAQVGLHAISSDGLSILAKNVANIIRTRNTFSYFLENEPTITRILPSATNFITCISSEADRLVHTLKSHGIYIRPLPMMFGQSGWLRFSVGSPEQMEKVIAALS